jgi:intracellular sulfur oxidation DsrE/DsrF family protein
MQTLGKATMAALIFLAAAMAGTARGSDYPALQGLTDVRAVIDFRAGEPGKALGILTLVERTYQDEALRRADGQPDFVVVFGGPAVKLLAKDRLGLARDEQEITDLIAAKVMALAKAGIRFEYCLYAARSAGVEPAEVPGVILVDNGWIASIGYQGKGYALVPAF